MKKLTTDFLELLSMATGCICIAALFLLPVAVLALILTCIFKLL